MGMVFPTEDRVQSIIQCASLLLQEVAPSSLSLGENVRTHRQSQVHATPEHPAYANHQALRTGNWADSGDKDTGCPTGSAGLHKFPVPSHGGLSHPIFTEGKDLHY